MMEGCDTLSTALVANTLVNKDLWIDSHPVDDQIKIGDSTFIKAVKIGSNNVLVKQPDGTMYNGKGHDLQSQVCSWPMVNLFSLTQPLKQGWKFSNEGLVMKIRPS
jgi:hypothetical protein